MDLRDRLRRAYGGRAKFVSLFQDGLEIPWDSLTIGEYVDYCRRASITPPEDLEDDIFLSHVRDEYVTSNIGTQKSGTVVRVAHDIVTQSWPPTAEELELIVNFHRAHTYPSVIEDLVIWIIRAFPGYTPDQIYEKGLDDFIHLFTLAEKKLQLDGILEGPITFSEQDKKSTGPEKRDLNSPESRQNRKQEFDRLHGVRPEQQTFEPVPEYDGEDTVIGKGDLLPEALASELDEGQARVGEVNRTAGIYSDLLAELDENDKITPELMKSKVQARRETDEARMEESKRECAETFARLRKKMKNEEVEADRKFKKGLGRRGRRRKDG